MTPSERAKRVGDVMRSNDRASEWFGMELLEIDEGYSVMSLRVGESHTNGHGICHGGIIFPA